MPLYSYRSVVPRLGKGVFLAPSAEIAGDVELGDDVSFWFHTVARGDVHWIRIGSRTNVQDGAVLHVTHDSHPLSIGSAVTIGHAAVVHGCTLEDECLVGMGARVLDGAVVGRHAQVGAGAVVPPGMKVPERTLVLGVPAREVRRLDDDAVEAIRATAERYCRTREHYAASLGWGTHLVRAPEMTDAPVGGSS